MIANFEEESCVEIRHGIGYKWNDRRCSEKVFFICEREQIGNEMSDKLYIENQEYYLGTVVKVNLFMLR